MSVYNEYNVVWQQSACVWCCGDSPVFQVVVVMESEVLEQEPEVTELEV